MDSNYLRDTIQYISLQEASQSCSYSQEYLRLLVRQGKIFGKKIGRNWYTTKDSLAEYTNSQNFVISIPKSALSKEPFNPKSFSFHREMPQTSSHQEPDHIRRTLEQLVSEYKHEHDNQSAMLLAKIESLSDSLQQVAEQVSIRTAYEEPVTEEPIYATSQSYQPHARINTTARIIAIFVTSAVAIFMIVGFSFGRLLRIDQYFQQVQNAFERPDKIAELIELPTISKASLFNPFRRQVQKSVSTVDLSHYLISAQQYEIVKNELSDLKAKLLSVPVPVTQRVVVNQSSSPKEVIRETVVREIVLSSSGVLLAQLEQRVQDAESRIQTTDALLTDLALDVDNLRSVTPTILQLPSTNTTGVGSQTVSNPALVDTQRLAVTGNGTVTGAFSSTGNLSVNTDAFFVDALNKRIGVGTNSPEVAFEVVGVSSISSNLSVGGNTTITGNLTLGSGTGTFGKVGINAGNNTDSPLEVGGTASISYFLTANGIQVGGSSSVSYSRFGTSTTGHSLSSASDLLIGGLLEVDSNAFFDNKVSISGNFQISGRFIADTSASHSFTGDLTISKELISSGGGSNSFSGSLEAAKGIHGVGDVSTSAQFLSTGAASNSFSGSLLVSKGFNAQSIVGTNLTINTGNVIGNGTGSSSFAGSLDVAKGIRGTYLTATSGVLTNSITAINSGTLTIGPFTLGGTISGNSQQINNISRLGIGTTPVTTFEVQGTASASYLLTGNTLQVGGYSSVGYSRFGTGTTTYATFLSAANDVLISGSLEADSESFFDSAVSISGNFQTAGRFVFGDNGDTGEINTSDWDISSTGVLSGISGITTN